MGDTWDESKLSIWWQIRRKEKTFSHLTVSSWSSESRTDLQNGILTQTQDADSHSFVQPSPAESPWLGGKSTVRLVGCLPFSAELFNSSLTGCFEGLPVETLHRIDTFPQILTEDLSEKSSESYSVAQCWYSVRVWLTFILEGFLLKKKLLVRFGFSLPHKLWDDANKSSKHSRLWSLSNHSIAEQYF